MGQRASEGAAPLGRNSRPITYQRTNEINSGVEDTTFSSEKEVKNQGRIKRGLRDEEKGK